MKHRCASLVVTVEIVAGTSETDASIDLQMLATDLGTIVEGKHNGIVMRARPGADWQEVLRDFEREKRFNDYPHD
jgi:hypothetical protein